MMPGPGILVFLILSLSISSPAQAASQNFSQYPGFEEWYEKNPPQNSPPSPADQELLRRYRPVFHVGDGQTRFIDFYKSYIAHGTLRDSAGRVLSTDVTPEVLNTNKDEPEVIFTHEPDQKQPPGAKVYGRITREQADWLGRPAGLTFLTYNIAFAHSGLTSGLMGWQKLALGLIGNPGDWHQLDHYTAVTVILNDQHTPFALMLQQHNYLRTYILGEIIHLPQDGHPAIDVAKGSNELYAHRNGRTSHRAVPFLTPGNFRYMMGTGRRPFLTADDVTEPEREVEYELVFLPPSDAFYTFKGFLGELRMLPGRDGPPGADYNTLPELKPMYLQMLAGYWRYQNQGDAERMELSFRHKKYWLAFARGQARVFFSNASCVLSWGIDCAFE